MLQFRLRPSDPVGIHVEIGGRHLAVDLFIRESVPAARLPPVLCHGRELP